VILDYFLQNQNFESAQKFSNDTNISVFSDIEIFLETNRIYQKLKALTAEN